MDWEKAWKYFPTNDSHSRYEDDSREGFISVVFSIDGDSWIGFCPDPNERRHSFRFRVPMMGGGQSPRVRKALMVLGMAIKADNEERPQKRYSNNNHG